MNTKRKYEDPTIEICTLSTVEDVLTGSNAMEKAENMFGGADLEWGDEV